MITAELGCVRPRLDIALRLEPGTTVLVGASGAGKTSLLRWLAGLLVAPGRLIVDGRTWQDGAIGVPAHRRAVAMVFQGESLLPHLTVRGNIDYARARSPDPLPFDQVVELAGLDRLVDRRVASLSGGEAQRAAIARAIATRPRLLLLDEALSALDPEARTELARRIMVLVDSLAIHCLLVSHDADALPAMPHAPIRIADGRAESLCAA